MTIGERIKQRRLSLGLTQEELAKKVGYKSRSSINKIELARALPLKKVELMAEALETTPSSLMGWMPQIWEDSDNPDLKEWGLMAFENEYKEQQELPLKLYEADKEYFNGHLLEYIEDKQFRELLFAADGCTKKQINSVIELLNSFKRGE